MENYPNHPTLARFTTTEPNCLTPELHSEMRRSGNSFVVSVPLCTTKSFNNLCTNRVPTEKNIASKNKMENMSHNNGMVEKIQKIDGKHEKIFSSYEYDPHEHYPGKHPTTYLDTMFHLLKAGLGTGVLAMPNAFNNAGWLVGIFGTMIIGFLCTYNVHLLVSCEYELCKRRKVPSMTFPEVVECAFEEGPRWVRWFAPCGKALTNFFILIYQVGSSAIYVVFMSSNFKQVHDTYMEDDINIRMMIVYMLVPLILICWVRDLKLLAPFSTVATALLSLSFILLFLYIFDDVPSLSERQPIGPLRSIPFFFSTVLFAMEAIGTIIPLKNAMKEPKTFGGCFGVLNVSMFPITLLYAFIGFFGYLKYGAITQGSITLNLPKNDVLANAVKILFCLSIYISYAIYNFIAFDILWTNGMKTKFVNGQNKLFWEYVVRTSIVLVTCIMAVAIPSLEMFISLIGAFCLSALGIAFPAVVQTLVCWGNYERSTLRFSILVLKNTILFFIAVTAFTVGVGTTVMEYFEIAF